MQITLNGQPHPIEEETTLSGLTLASPVVTGNWSWTGGSELDMSDSGKSFKVQNIVGLAINDASGNGLDRKSRSPESRGDV